MARSPEVMNRTSWSTTHLRYQSKPLLRRCLSDCLCPSRRERRCQVTPLDTQSDHKQSTDTDARNWTMNDMFYARHQGLQLVPLGRTGMYITRVGFGAWALGGGDWAVGWGQQDDANSIAAIRHAVSRGVNWIDTAAVYGLGRSERVVGTALRSIAPSERPLVFTKCGLVWDDARPQAAPRQVANPLSIRREVEASLRRLGVEHIDLYQVHWPWQDGTPLEEYWQTMLDLKREGKVRAVGLSNHDAGQLARA